VAKSKIGRDEIISVVDLTVAPTPASNHSRTRRSGWKKRRSLSRPRSKF
jgi:hypothetical protein